MLHLKQKVKTMLISFPTSFPTFPMYISGHDSRQVFAHMYLTVDTFSECDITVKRLAVSKPILSLAAAASITAANMNITSDFMKGQASGSYKCDAKVTETLSGGVIFETTNLQYKAFNSDNSTDFPSDSKFLLYSVICVF